jgi:hypothetical protein
MFAFESLPQIFFVHYRLQNNPTGSLRTVADLFTVSHWPSCSNNSIKWGLVLFAQSLYFPPFELRWSSKDLDDDLVVHLGSKVGKPQPKGLTVTGMPLTISTTQLKSTDLNTDSYNMLAPFGLRKTVSLTNTWEGKGYQTLLKTAFTKGRPTRTSITNKLFIECQRLVFWVHCPLSSFASWIKAIWGVYP